MRRTLQVLAVVVTVVTITLWIAKGANTGWTKTKIQVWTVDEVTEIRTPEWREKFVPGLDFLGVGLFLAGAVVVASRFFRKTTNQ